MCRYVSTTYTECSHSKTNTFRCGASFDAFPHAPTSACRAVEEHRVRSSYPHCMTCRRIGKGVSKLNLVSNFANRFVSFIDGALGYKTKAKAKIPRTTYFDSNPSFLFDTADDVKTPTTTTSSIEEPVDTDSWSTHVEKHAEDYKNINAGWGVGTRDRKSWFSYENGDESHFSVGPRPIKRKPVPSNSNATTLRRVPSTNTDDRASLPSRRSTPPSTPSLVPEPLNIPSRATASSHNSPHSSRSAARDTLHLPGPPREIPGILRAGGPRPDSFARGFAGANGGHYDFSNKRHGIIFDELPEFDDTDSSSIELDIPSYHGSNTSSEIELAGTEINPDIPSCHGSDTSSKVEVAGSEISRLNSGSEVAELNAETSTPVELDTESTTPTPTSFELEAPAPDPAYDGSLYGDFITNLPEDWNWISTSPSPSPPPTLNRDELLFQHPSLRQNWSTAPRTSAAPEPTLPHFARRVPGAPPTRFEDFELPVGGNEVEVGVPMYEGSLLGSISRFWA